MFFENEQETEEFPVQVVRFCDCTEADPSFSGDLRTTGVD